MDRARLLAIHGAQQCRQIQPTQARRCHILDDVGEQRALLVQNLADSLLDARCSSNDTRTVLAAAKKLSARGEGQGRIQHVEGSQQ